MNIRLICWAHILKNKIFCEIYSSFIALEKLTLSLLCDEQIILIIEPIKNCKKLRYFELNINYLKGNTFENIELFLPKLQTIIVNLGVNFKSDSGIFQNLAKSKSLTKLVIVLYYCSEIIDSLISDVLKICFNIREVYFNGSRFKITRKTIIY